MLVKGDPVSFLVTVECSFLGAAMHNDHFAETNVADNKKIVNLTTLLSLLAQVPPVTTKSSNQQSFIISGHDFDTFTALVERTTTLSTNKVAPWHILYTYTSSAGACPYRKKISLGWFHDEIIWKRFPQLLTLCEGNPSVTSGFPSQYEDITVTSTE